MHIEDDVDAIPNFEASQLQVAVVVCAELCGPLQ